MTGRSLGVCVGVLAVIGAAGWGLPAKAQAIGAVAPRITPPVDENNLVTLRGTVHPLARAQYDQGAVADSQPIRRGLLLLQRSPEQETALRQLLDSQQTKTSPSFHQWLTPAQFGQQYGPSDADVQAVTSWLTAQGFTVNRVSEGRTVIEFSGNAGQVRNAFHTEIHHYGVNGETHFANASAVRIPVALAPVVAGVVSLHNFPKKAQSHVLGVFSKNKATGEVKPLVRLVPTHAADAPSPTFTFSLGGCSLTGNTCFAVGPADFDTIYNVPTNLDGTGQTIAIVGDSEICTAGSASVWQTIPESQGGCGNADDVAKFRSLFGLPANPPNIILDGPDPGLNGDEIEGDLDVQWSGAVAKNATIDFVIAEGTEASAGIDLAAEHIVDNNLAPVMSESFSSCEAFLTNGESGFYSALWEQAAAQGITVIVSAGDSGAAGCDDQSTESTALNGNAVNGIASTPFNVAAGGTDFNYTATNYASTYWNTTNAANTEASAKSYIPETTWNDSCAQSLTGATTGCTPPPNLGTLNIVGGAVGRATAAILFLPTA